MSIGRTIRTAALMMGFALVVVAGTTGYAAEETAQPKVKKQTLCPIMGEAINKALYVDHEGKRIYVCCAGCIKAVQKDPGAFVKTLEAAGITLDATPAAPAAAPAKAEQPTAAAATPADAAQATARCGQCGLEKGSAACRAKSCAGNGKGRGRGRGTCGTSACGLAPTQPETPAGCCGTCGKSPATCRAKGCDGNEKGRSACGTRACGLAPTQPETPAGCCGTCGGGTGKGNCALPTAKAKDLADTTAAEAKANEKAKAETTPAAPAPQPDASATAPETTQQPEATDKE